jgi:hypothetical protein
MEAYRMPKSASYLQLGCGMESCLFFALAKKPFVHVYIIPRVFGSLVRLERTCDDASSRPALIGPKSRRLPVDRLRQIAHQRAISRCDFLRSAAMVGTTSCLPGFSLRAAPLSREVKMVVVTFGGGARNEETFAPEGQENIPHLMNELIPQATFFTQVVNRGILGHCVATASLATGVYERSTTSPMSLRRTRPSLNTSVKA